MGYLLYAREWFETYNGAALATKWLDQKLNALHAPLYQMMDQVSVSFVPDRNLQSTVLQWR